MTSSAPLPDEFSDQPFLVGEGLAAGLSRRRLRGRDLHRPFHGVRAAEVPANRRDQLRAAAARLRPGQALGGSAAAAMWGIPLPPRLARLDTPVVVVARRGGTVPQGKGFVGVRLLEDRLRTEWLDGIRVTDPATTWALLAREIDRRDLVAAGDILITDSRRTKRRCAPVAIEHLVATAERWRRSPGSVAMRGALELMRPGVDSPMESALRLLIVEGGFPEPAVHPAVRLRHGGVWHPDLGYELLRLGIEYEGEGHADIDRMREDITRYEDFAEVDWTILRVTVRDLYPSPARFLQRLAVAIDRCQRRLRLER